MAGPAAAAGLLLALAACSLIGASRGSGPQLGEDEQITLLESAPGAAGSPGPRAAGGPAASAGAAAATDPFEVTFEDYLREASQNGAHHLSGGAEQPKTEPAGSEAAAAAAESNGQQQLTTTTTTTTSSTPAPQLAAPQFAWRRRLTSRCSRDCGRGFRLQQVSCVDLKFEVRVEDALCQTPAEPHKPAATSGEPCNQHDCPPQWTSVEGPGAGPEAHGVFRRVQCVMVDGHGASVYLEDARCANSSAAPTPVVGAPTSSAAPEPASSPSIEYQVVDSNEPNDILSNVFASDALEALLHQAHQSHQNNNNNNLGPPHNEPYYEPGPWSECRGAPCGQLGRRQRKLACRLYLSRSAKFAELPDASCQNVPAPPDTHEPCYIDCADQQQQQQQQQQLLLPGSGPQTAPGPSPDLDTVSIGHMSNSSSDADADELVYDADMARFSWLHNGWTACSAHCDGGWRESIVECWDTVAGGPGDVSLCSGSSPRPEARREACNEHPCAPRWRPGPFSACSRSCGAAGVRTRSLYCAKRIAAPERAASARQEAADERDVDDGERIVPDELCHLSALQASRPHTLEPCNRHDCEPEWQPGPWSACNARCGLGVANRTLICVQELAARPAPALVDAPAPAAAAAGVAAALELAKLDWGPDRAVQVPFQRCFDYYKTVPAVEQRCAVETPCEPPAPYIEAEPQQHFRLARDSLRRRTVTLRVGGQAELLEGRNLKIRCKLVHQYLHIHHHHHQQQQQQHNINNNNNNNNNQHNNYGQLSAPNLTSTAAKTTNLVINSGPQAGGPPVAEWFKDGVRIFANGSTLADKVYLSEADNSLLDNELLYMADQPAANSGQAAAGGPHAHLGRPRAPGAAQGAARGRARALNVRSWPSSGSSSSLNTSNFTHPASTASAWASVERRARHNGGQPPPGPGFQFVASHAPGKFALIKDNTLRIRRLRSDDSGLYTCAYAGGALTESLELAVLTRRDFLMGEERLANQHGGPL